MLSTVGLRQRTIGAGIALAAAGEAGAQTPRAGMIVDAQAPSVDRGARRVRWCRGRQPQLPEPATSRVRSWCRNGRRQGF